MSTPLLIAEFMELCRLACIDLKRRASTPLPRDYYWREVCTVIAERLDVHPPVLMPPDDYELGLRELAGIAGLDEHEAFNIARKYIEEAVTLR